MAASSAAGGEGGARRLPQRRLLAREEGLCVTLARCAEDAELVRRRVAALLLSLPGGSVRTKAVRGAAVRDIADWLGLSAAAAEARRARRALLELRQQLYGGELTDTALLDAATDRGELWPQGARGAPPAAAAHQPQPSQPSAARGQPHHTDPAAAGGPGAAQEQDEQLRGVATVWQLIDAAGRGAVPRQRLHDVLCKMGERPQAVAALLDRCGCPVLVTERDFARIVDAM
eukprot:TRINITY_DN35912_c0_g1_i1.p2 TRINITY_DN35912_c0_g1~~TRINITY_DN35912_c0_g1_i1.p2  ORF type:complete len:251 (+),score=76.13 TRINITY_DN35912_c0_g1_i1:63-755(+)